jgi:secondary thiamine-phosphate synthase enzyme
VFEENIQTMRREELISVTPVVQKALKTSGIEEGICIVYIPHTTAGVTINENADPDVARDILMGLNKIVPCNWPFQHAEGNADAHIKATLVGSSVTIFVKNKRLALGTWQGIFFCEFDGPRSRSILIQFIPKSG